ncbi:hypothetical protein PAECIP111891_04974 [Paenibacillus allorhizoplanae]|uniref:Uncharacterized protein n=2 Tax=Paenibacillus TaxID=44249 RepID=A0ABU1NUN2_9BACL|nr:MULTISPECIES: hypothetical protein [Paenibacillus]MDR6551191.1 hypothetical protein [Paenibacillus qinlingensis]CAH1219786.1 hypothetical protein PAECIP111891_04974 [Paenibacillus allorhizoplanae]
MKSEQFNGIFDSVLTDVVQQSYGNICLPSDEQIQQSMKKMMSMLEENPKWLLHNE